MVSLLSDDITYDQESFEYDQNGNQVKLVRACARANGDTYTYEYGERNRLEAVYLQKADASDPRLYLTFTYDPQPGDTERGRGKSDRVLL